MAQLTVRIDDDLKGHLQNLARQEGKSTSDVVRSLVEHYVQDRDRGTALRFLRNRMQRSAEKAEAGPAEGETETERRYLIFSLKADAEKILEASRRHWQIENEPHWTLDVVFAEDHGRCEPRTRRRT
ncbi:MAG: ribbon-helix-helix protein, CopG family [Salinibacter sp.]